MFKYETFSVTFSPDGRYALWMTRNGYLSLWETGLTMQPIPSITPPKPLDDNGSEAKPAPQAEYDEGYKAGYEAGISECKASFSPSDGSVYIPCIDVPTEKGIIRYKVIISENY